MYDKEKDPAFIDNPYLTDYDLMMSPCDNPNPPSWCEGTGGPCNNPNHGPYCDGVHSVPIDGGFLLLTISMIYGMYLIRA